MTSIQLDHVTVVRNQAELITDISLTVGSGEFLALIGPSGSGKTTVLRAIAGLDDVESGDVLFDGEPVNDLRPAQRDIAMVFQDNALIPFKNVRQNVAFPLEMHHVEKQEIGNRVMAESRAMALDRFLTRMPRELGAGHQQLVQAARALVRRPHAFLLDEPLARVDPIRRSAMRREIKMLADGYGVTTVYATNDPAEAMALGDRIAMIDGGKLRQIGTPDDLYQRPLDTVVAGFIGLPPMAFMDGELSEREVRVSAGSLAVNTRGRTGKVIVGVRPHEWDVVETAGLVGTVLSVEELGDRAYVMVDLAGDQVTVRVDNLRPKPGETIEIWARRPHLFTASGHALR
ncbi:MAG: ABC transporter ATP-binding protein [Acidimicrobiia bacterium]